MNDLLSKERLPLSWERCKTCFEGLLEVASNPKKVKEAMLDLPVEQFCQNSEAFYHDFPVQFIKCKNGAKKSISASHDNHATF